jgi:hypothetical protein
MEDPGEQPDGRHARRADSGPLPARNRTLMPRGAWQFIVVLATVLALPVAGFAVGHQVGKGMVDDVKDQRDSALRQRDEGAAKLQRATLQLAQTTSDLQKANARIKKLEDDLRPPKLKQRTAAPLRLRLEMTSKPPQQTWDLAHWDTGTAKSFDFFVEQRKSELTFTPYIPLDASAALVKTASLSNVDVCTSATSYTREPIRLERDTTICLRNPGQSLSLLQVTNLRLVPVPASPSMVTTVDFLVTVRPPEGP